MWVNIYTIFTQNYTINQELLPYFRVKFQRSSHCFWKIYTADKNFTRPPVAPVAPNINSVCQNGSKGSEGFKLVKMAQIGLKGSKWINRIQMGPWIPLYTSCLALAFLGNFGEGAHDDVWRYIVPCGGERLALQSLIPRHWTHPTFQGPPLIILPILIPSASSCKPSLRITEKVKRDHNPFFSFSYFWI